MAQRQFSSIRNDYEITFDANSAIQEAQDEGNIQVAVYNFKKVRPSARCACLQVDTHPPTHPPTHDWERRSL